MATENHDKCAPFRQCLAAEERLHAQHVEWVRRKVAAAKADTHSRLTTQQVRASLQNRFKRLRDVPR
jgi:hypothetical protein